MDAVKLLKNKGLKKTTQRVTLINILEEEAFALSEDDIRQKMGDLYDRITFYRTVQTLLDAGIIHRITVDNKTVKYALNEVQTVDKDHVHFFCKSCQAITCLEDIPATSYKLPDGYRDEEYEIIIKGMCKKCSEEQ